MSRKHLAIALVSAAIMLLQISVTRVLSVLLWYHFAFFSISLAMLGVGVPGVWLALRRRRPRRLAAALLSAAVLVPLGLALMIQEQHRFGPWSILFCMLCLLPAMLALGAAVCLLLMAAPGAAVGRMYAFDLLGACLGALLVVPLMSAIPTPLLAAGIGLLPLCAYALLFPRGRPRALVIAVLLGVALWWGHPYELRHTKEYAEAGPRFSPIYEKWTPTARLTVFDSFPWTPDRPFQWGAGRKGADLPAPPQYYLEQDGSAGTPIIAAARDAAELEYVLYDVTSVGFQLRRPERVAIVGAGGGRDILTARLAGARSIDAIELNAGIVEALRGPFASFSGGVYDQPGVHAIVGEGRSVLTRSAGGYDLIQIAMIDSWAATAAGAYALSENNLYTVEAYRLYYSRLSATGLLATSRWKPSPRFAFELPRLVILAHAALRAERVDEPLDHLAVVQGGKVGTVLLSRSAWSAEDVAQLERICDQRGFDLLYPETTGAARQARWVRRWLETGPALAERGIHLAPPTDDRPFFFQMASPFRPITPALAASLGVSAQSVAVLRTLMMAMSVVTLVLFFAPFALSRWLPRRAGFWRGSLFFCCIGLAFMLVEIAWLQRFVLYLGHPSRATTAALACLLLGAGLGSMCSAAFGLRRARRWGWLVALATAALNAALPLAFGATLGWPLIARVLVAAALLIPPGFVMGFCFPLGMQRFGEEHKAWFWALNGAASVLASVLSLALAMQLGLTAVAFIGAGLYALAWLLLGGRAARPLPS